MSFNPFRTLAGQLVLVTIVAIAISHIVAFTLFANEQGRAFRREAEARAIERIVDAAQSARAVPPSQRDDYARNETDRRARFSIVADPLDGVRGAVASRIAREVSDQLDGAETRAQSRRVEARLPRWGQAWTEGGERVRRRVTEAVVDVQIGPRAWLRARVFLPAPRPPPTYLWFAALGSMLAVGIGAALISRQIGRPLADLASAAQRFGQGEGAVVAPVSGPEDVRRASNAFNAMAERLGRQLSRQRQMLWALSHDLRTPITALKLRAELIEDESARQRLLAPLQEMELLTEQALALARAGASEEARVRVDLSEIARTLCGELQELGFDIRAEAAEPVFAECRPSEIARALRNLAENAAKYGGGGVMRVSRGERGEAVIEVFDQGPGLSADMLARVTEPFFRADPARSGPGGAGLGLAIAQAIADGHGGRLVLQNRSPRGLSAKLILPG